MNRVTVKPSPSVVRVVTECLCEVAERTGKEVGALEMAKWYEAFAVCQPFELREAFDNHALTSPFAPSMAAIRQELDRSRFGGISGAWLMVREAALACAGRTRHPLFHRGHRGVAFGDSAGPRSRQRLIRSTRLHEGL